MKPSILILPLLLISLNALYAGGPWPQPKSHGFFKLSEWWIIADRHFTDAGEIDPNLTNGVFTTSLYAEYGLTDRHQVLLSPVWGDLEPRQLAEWALADGLDVRVQIQLHKLLWGAEAKGV